MHEVSGVPGAVLFTDLGRPQPSAEFPDRPGAAAHRHRKSCQVGDLRRDIRMVLERGQTMERSAARFDRPAQYLMRFLPYRSRNE
jgi:hypothetical protein